MAPTTITQDYYEVLEVEQTATPDEIIRSYKRLAFLRHPDKNATHDTTESFQLLGAAYETLKDETTRRNYDLIYPQIKNTRTPPRQTPQTPRPTPRATKSNQDDTKEAEASISAILRAKQERFASWSKVQKVYDDAIFELRRDINKLRNVIREFEDIEKAERAEVAAANSWTTWFLSPLYQRPVITEDEKEQKERDRLQRLYSKNFRERNLGKIELELRDREILLTAKRQEFDDANRRDDIAKSVVEDGIRAKREWERREKERVEREEAQRVWMGHWMARQMEEARERAKMKEKQAAEQKKREQTEEAARKERAEEVRKRKEAARLAETYYHTRSGQRSFSEAGSSRHFSAFNTGSTSSSTTRSPKDSCRHAAWWSKVEGRRACENCSMTYGYLLQCPHCNIEACASCQQTLRPPRRN